MLDHGLLQLIRLEISLFGRAANGLPCLSGVDPAKLRMHVERLYYGGEIAGSAKLGPDGLTIEIQGLTPYGLLAMHAYRAKHAGAKIEGLSEPRAA